MKRNYIAAIVLASSSFLSLSAMIKVLPLQENDEKVTIENEFKEVDLETTLLCAASEGSLDLVKKLIEKNNVNVDVKSKSGYTPLHFAVWNWHYKVAKYLLKKGASINAQAADGKTALHLAIETDCPRLVMKLFKAEDIKMLEDNTGRQPIHCAALKGVGYIWFFLSGVGLEKTKLLINNAKAANGITPLHDAASKGNMGCVKMFVEFGANIGALTDDGKSAIDYANMNGHDEVASYLEEQARKSKKKVPSTNKLA